MIEITLTELAFWAVGLAMALVVAGAWGSILASAKEERRALQSRAVCRLCLAVFQASGRDAEQHCPVCGAKTDRQGPTPLG